MSAAKPAPDRRTILGGSLALASAVAASAAPAHPDAALLQLVADYFAADQRLKEQDRLYEEAFDRLDVLPPPEALFYRPDDWSTVFPMSRHPSQLATYEHGGIAVPAYDNGVADLAHWVAPYLANGAMPLNSFPRPADCARAREIADAHQAWQAAVRQAEDAAGLTAARNAGERENDLMHGLLRRIATTPATTPEGLQAKARAAIDDMADAGATWLADRHIPDLLSRKAQSMEAHPCCNLAVVLSLVVDAARLGMPTDVIEAAA